MVKTKEKLHKGKIRGAAEDLKDLGIRKRGVREAPGLGSRREKVNILNLPPMRPSCLLLLAKKKDIRLNERFRSPAEGSALLPDLLLGKTMQSHVDSIFPQWV